MIIKVNRFVISFDPHTPLLISLYRHQRSCSVDTGTSLTLLAPPVPVMDLNTPHSLA